jgi:hypothetical protein
MDSRTRSPYCGVLSVRDHRDEVSHRATVFLRLDSLYLDSLCLGLCWGRRPRELSTTSRLSLTPPHAHRSNYCTTDHILLLSPPGSAPKIHSLD